jgi:hypothetical protein
VNYLVITKIPTEEESKATGGNLAAVMELYKALDGQPGRHERIDPLTCVLVLRAPVFTLGEVLIVDGDGREMAGQGRKPSKWDVSYEEFDDPEQAVARAIEVQCQPQPQAPEPS